MAADLDKLPHRFFALTGEKVSVLGLGTVKFGRNRGVKYPGWEGASLPSDREISSLLDLCIEEGINLIDTAPAYGTSEERLGALMGSRRRNFFIVSKTGEEFNNGKSEYIFSAEHTRTSVERSLRQLKTEYLDCVLVHSSKNDLEIINDTPVLETLSRLKEQGKIRSFGVSTYSVEGGRRAVDLSDAVMVSYNKNYLTEKEVIDYARQHGKAVLVKKGLASGNMGVADVIEENIRFILKTSGVTSLVFGSISPANILSNIRTAKGLCMLPLRRD
ncbi:MAG: aldo/keto reductase [Alphaproteobacteria bacterium]|nr:aldo/keto reductase [Alphaproteobacteria bacterium]MCK5554906.1 aldo/keto reductase [Alphaproteobacteria bacterium]